MAVVQEELVLQEALVLLRQPLPAATCLPLLYACVYQLLSARGPRAHTHPPNFPPFFFAPAHSLLPPPPRACLLQTPPASLHPLPLLRCPPFPPPRYSVASNLCGWRAAVGLSSAVGCRRRHARSRGRLYVCRSAPRTGRGPSAPSLGCRRGPTRSSLAIPCAGRT